MNSDVGKMGKYQAIKNITPISLVDSRLKHRRKWVCQVYIFR